MICRTSSELYKLTLEYLRMIYELAGPDASYCVDYRNACIRDCINILINEINTKEALGVGIKLELINDWTGESKEFNVRPPYFKSELFGNEATELEQVTLDYLRALYISCKRNGADESTRICKCIDFFVNKINTCETFGSGIKMEPFIDYIRKCKKLNDVH